MNCPVCKLSLYVKPRLDLEPHPYVECLNCGLYYQQNFLPKVYEASHEVRGDLMSGEDKAANNHLAQCLYNNHIKKLNKDQYFHLNQDTV